MNEARALLAEAEELETHEPRLSALVSDLDWMRAAMSVLRGAEVARSAPIHGLVAAKYAVCVAGALASASPPLVLIDSTLAAAAFALVLALIGFYLVEAQLVFLVPLALDGARSPWRDARGLTRAAGGTLRVVSTVVPIAAWMLAGLFTARGVVREWRVGCLAVLLWYERLRVDRDRAR